MSTKAAAIELVSAPRAINLETVQLSQIAQFFMSVDFTNHGLKRMDRSAVPGRVLKTLRRELAADDCRDMFGSIEFFALPIGLVTAFVGIFEDGTVRAYSRQGRCIFQ